MAFLLDKCIFSPLNDSIIEFCTPFDCDHKDLNDFFLNDSRNYSKELLGKSYCFYLEDNPKIIVAAFTISNDSIKANFLPNGRKKRVTKRIPFVKQFRTYPAVLIGRLGVNVDYKSNGIGRELLDFIKAWFVDKSNKTGCRFIVVDSYNDKKPMDFYLKNSFEYLFTTEEQEKKYAGLKNNDKLETRLMFFDLINLVSIN